MTIVFTLSSALVGHGVHVLAQGLWIILRIWPGQVIVCSSYPCSSPCPGTVTGTTGQTSWLITPLHGSWPVSVHLVRGVMWTPLALSCLYCNSIVVVFTTYWNIWCCCIHCLFGVNECQQLVYTHTFSFIPTWCYLIVSHTCIMFLLTQCSIHEYKTINNVSKFTHSNCITLSYYSSPKQESDS